MNCDVVVIGDGLAALSVTKLLSSSNYKVCMLVHKKNKPGILLEHVQDDFLNRLHTIFPEGDLSGVFLPCQKYTSAWSTTFADHSRALKGYNFDKNQLLTRIERGMGSVVTRLLYDRIDSCIRPDDQSWRLSIRNDQQAVVQINSAWIIDASGRNSSWSVRYQTVKHYLDDHLAINQIYDYNQPPAELFFSIESVSDGWWYAINLWDSVQLTFVTSASMTKPWDAQKVWDQNLQLTYYTKGLIHDTRMSQALFTQDARLSLLQDMAGSGWLTSGDAALTTDPLCGIGNSTVLDQAVSVFEAIRDPQDHSGGAYDRKHQTFFVNHLQNLRAYYQMEKRWPDSIFWFK